MINISTVLQQYLNKYLYRHPALLKSILWENRTLHNYPPLILTQIKRFVSQINPFKLCPFSIYFWFLIEPYNAIGVSIMSLKEVRLFWRQQMEPNETVYLMFNLLSLRLPFPLTMLVLFSASGLVILDGINKLFQSSESNPSNEPERTKELSPTNLLPKMSIYFPVINGFTSIGFLTIDFRHIEMSVKQVLEPNETIFSLIRFIDLYSPYPMQLAVMVLAMGLFLTGHISNLIQEKVSNILLH